MHKAAPKDIEELVSVAKESRTCPYFASREAVSQAEVRLSSSVQGMAILLTSFYSWSQCLIIFSYSPRLAMLWGLISRVR